MDENTKYQLNAEISTLKSLLPGAISNTSALQQTAYPVTGPIVVITSLPMAAQAIKAQNDCILKLLNIVEKFLKES